MIGHTFFDKNLLWITGPGRGESLILIRILSALRFRFALSQNMVLVLDCNSELLKLLKF